MPLLPRGRLCAHVRRNSVLENITQDKARMRALWVSEGVSLVI